MKTENIQEICNHLLPAVQATAKGSNIGDLDYSEEKQDIYVLKRNGGHATIGAAGRDGLSVIRDILDAIETM